MLDSGYSAHTCTFTIHKIPRVVTVLQAKADQNGSLIIMRSVADFRMKSSVEELKLSVGNYSAATLQESLSPQNMIPLTEIHPRLPSVLVAPEGAPAKRLSVAARLQGIIPNSATTLQSLLPMKEVGTVYLFGYQVKASPNDPNASTVTCITSLSPELRSLEVDITACRKLKQFIEDLVQLTESVDDVKLRTSPDDLNSMNKFKSYFENIFLKASAAINKPKSGDAADKDINEDTTPVRVHSFDTPASPTDALRDAISEPLKQYLSSAYTDKLIPFREILSIDFPVICSEASIFTLEFLSRLEAFPYIGVHYVPNEPVSFLQGGSLVLVPVSNFQTYTRPFIFSYNLGALPSGVIVVTFDNIQPSLSKYRPKQVNYCCRTEVGLKQESSASVAIQRGQNFVLNVPLYKALNVNLSFQATELFFSIQFKSKTEQTQTIICPASKLMNLTGSKFENLDVSGMDGVLALTWDNSHSLVTSKKITYSIVTTLQAAQ